MFLYHSLTVGEKAIINKEISRAIKGMVLKTKNFNYSEREFVSTVNELTIHSKEIDRLLGLDSISYFNLKATVVKYKALEIAYGIQYRKPSLERLEHLLKLCIMFREEPFTDMFFDSILVEGMISAYEYRLVTNEKICNNVVDLKNILDYTKSSNTIWFVETMYELYKC